MMLLKTMQMMLPKTMQMMLLKNNANDVAKNMTMILSVKKVNQWMLTQQGTKPFKQIIL